MYKYLKSKYGAIAGKLDRLDNKSTFYLGDNIALTKLFTGQHIYVDTRDSSVAPHLMIDGAWEPEITKIWLSLVEPDSVVFDIGANFGYYGVIAGSKAARHDKQIHFFEANPALTPLIARTCSINGLMNSSTVSNVAVSDKKSTLELSVFENFIGSSRVTNSNYVENKDFKVSGKIKVDSLAIDSYVKENKISKVDLIKIDVEGHEDKAYAGLKKTISANKNIKVLLEFTDGDYDDANKFYDDMKSDFKYISAVSNDGSLKPVSSYKVLKKLASKDWVMLLLANQNHQAS